FGAGDKAHADIGRHETLQQFAGIEFHSQVRLQVMVIEQGVEGVAGVAEFGQNQWIGRDLGHGDALLRRERMTRSRDHHEFVAVNHLRLESVVGHGQRDHAKVHHVLDNRLENPGVVGTPDAHGDVGIVALELREYLGQDVQAGAFIGAHHNFAAGNALGLGDLGEDRLAPLQRLFGILEKQFAGCGERDASARAVEQAGAYFFLQRTDLGGNGGLGAKTLLRRAGETGEARYFQENFELIEVHRVLVSDTIASLRQSRKENQIKAMWRRGFAPSCWGKAPPPHGAIQTLITAISSFTAAALLSRAAFSSAVNLISMICSIPLAPSFTGTPTKSPWMPYSPLR